MNSGNKRTLCLITYGEISLKGKNRAIFLARLEDNIRDQMGGISVEVTSREGRMFLTVGGEDESKKAAETLSRTFGIASFSRALAVEKEMGVLRKHTLELAEHLRSAGKRFKIEARRTDKSFPLNSYGICCDLGDHLNRSMPGLKVDLTHPDWTIHVEIRESAYLYGETVKGLGGLPVGCSGKGLLLLSGGIDSPVAGYMMAKRGLSVDSIYFHTHPYTSRETEEKVSRLAGVLATFVPRSALIVVPFTDVQLRIVERCHPSEVTLLSRACMMRIASLLAEKQGARCLVTGESLGQVASQTLESLSYTAHGLSLPVFRPLIGMDKEEIISVARRIETYEISILPYPDCCTLFAPARPLTHPPLERMMRSFRDLDVEDLLEEAAEGAEERLQSGSR
jgi:thiamine biosynthesis protein ThiI